jgi:uncharacterized membrane protein
MKVAVTIRVVLLVFFIAYPFLVYFGIQFLPPSFFGLVIVTLLAMRFGVLESGERLILLPGLLVFLVYAITAVILDSARMILFYPALVNFVMAAVFANSLRSEESLLLRIVRSRGFAISAVTPRYLHRLTALWAVFFVLNALVSIWTITLSMEAWTLYNGFISYCIIALLFGVEYLFRRSYKKRMGVWNP